jgi:hypothetical protein
VCISARPERVAAGFRLRDPDFGIQPWIFRLDHLFSGLLIPVSGSKARLFTNFLRFSPLAFQFPATFIRSEMRTPEGV